MQVEEDEIKGVVFLPILKNCLKARVINFWEWEIGRALRPTEEPKILGPIDYLEKILACVYLPKELTGKR